MIFRLIGISACKWLVTFVMIALLYVVIPLTVNAVVPLLLAWAVAFISAWLFAAWAFHPSIPDQRAVWTVFGIWMAVTITAYLFFVFRVSSLGLSGFLSFQLMVQLALEAIAIHLAGFMRKRRMLKQELGE